MPGKRRSTLAPPLSALLANARFAHGDNLLAGILRDIPDAILLVDASGRIVYRNDSATRLFGFRSAEAGGEHIFDVHPSSAPRAELPASLWELLERDDRIENYETQLLAKDGRVIDAISSKTAIRDAQGNIIGYWTVVKDITSIKESERRIARRNAQLLALNAVAEAITDLPGGAPLLDHVLDAVLRVTSLESGCVHLHDDEDESLALAAQRGLSPRAAQLLARFEMGEGIIGCAAVIGEPLIVTDTTNDGRMARRNLFEEKIGAFASVPLVGRSGVRGVLSLFHDAPRLFTEHEKGMLDAIGRQVGVALERALLFDEVTTAHREWERTFEALTDGVSLHATSGRIRRANTSLAALFSTTTEALIGLRCCELYHGSPKPRPDCTIMRTVTERAGQRVELHDLLRGRVLRVTTDPIINPQGRVTGVVCTTRDVTDEKLIERRLIQQERISAVGEVAAGIAHEVGTPLNIITANVEYLLRRPATNGAAGSDELEAIREQTNNITTLVRQLLDFSRDRAPAFAPVNVNELIERTVGLLAHQLNHEGVRSELRLAPYIPTVDGDATQLQQVLFNVINNARQAMESIDGTEGPGDAVLRITTDSALMPTEAFNDPHVIITIGDTGRGIPPEALPHVFKPFFTAHKEGGTGLGLAISHRIIQRHLGLLTIESAVPRGTLVRIRLPLSQT